MTHWLEQQLNKPCSPNFQDANQTTPLYAAARNGCLKCVLLLLEAGADKEKRNGGTRATALYVAAANGHLEVVRLLVESGANMEQGTKDVGATSPFHSSSGGAP